MVVCSMTSWPPRIRFVANAVRSILNQTCRPDYVELNLAVENFRNRDRDLPEELVELTKSGDITINWVEKDTNVFKKISPVVRKYYGSEYVLFSIDDDAEYGDRYIERMLEMLGDNDAYCPYGGVVGFITCFRSRIFRPAFWECITPALVENGIADAYINEYLKRVGARFVGTDAQDIKDMVRGVAALVSPNSERIGGYTPERCRKAAILSRQALINV